jgi:hypothetical protein
MDSDRFSSIINIRIVFLMSRPTQTRKTNRKAAGEILKAIVLPLFLALLMSALEAFPDPSARPFVFAASILTLALVMTVYFIYKHKPRRYIKNGLLWRWENNDITEPVCRKCKGEVECSYDDIANARRVLHGEKSEFILSCQCRSWVEHTSLADMTKQAKEYFRAFWSDD